MIKRGPVDMLVLALGEPTFDGSILRELKRQSANGVIRVLDAMILFKAPDGKCWSVDIEDLPASDLEALSFIPMESRGLFDSEDAETLWEGMVPDSAVIALAIEHAWAVDLVNALDAAGVEVAMNVRIPAVVVDEAFAGLEAEA
ncbi:MAG: hypothetical protein KJ046_05105 [Anaerolineae bacterium]|nr:hypothetical protein [Anaerolineae bacterium]